MCLPSSLSSPPVSTARSECRLRGDRSFRTSIDRHNRGNKKSERERGTETDVLAAAEQEDLGSRLLLFLTRDRRVTARHCNPFHTVVRVR